MISSALVVAIGRYSRHVPVKRMARSPAAGADVKELTLRSPTLDDVFLELTGTRMTADEERAREREEAAA